MLVMATTLRLDDTMQEALRAEAARVGQSQHEIIRTALSRYLRLQGESSPNHVDELLSTTRTRQPRSSYRRVQPSIRLRRGQTSLSLLERDDRV